ncbi:MAG: PP2C family protein-serine/threonine phosphatase [Pirellulaceae bacterium]
MNQASRQSRMYLNQDMPRPLVEHCLDGQVGVFSHRCPGKSTSNEDSVAIIEVSEEFLVLAVADGLGGGPEGEKASRLAVQTLRQEVQATLTAGVHPRAAILNGFEAANEVVLQSVRGGATTLAVAEIRDGFFRPYHVGDSVLLLMSNRGRVKYESISHSPVGYGIEAGVLDREEALYRDDRHWVSNVIGSEEMRIEIGPQVAIAPRDTVLVTSDGLIDNLRVAEIVEEIRKGDLQRGIESLVEKTRKRMEVKVEGQPSKPDDFTLALYRPMGLASQAEADEVAQNPVTLGVANPPEGWAEPSSPTKPL